ncbi:uncharacterized protein LOC143599599 [Bidens hawaiensis]|uniref:uncharacterized protein LOC143599599 n=1 Tax=Bidens hawaiensis TaxID=980011 RepID=UPI00404A6FA6
MDILKQELLKKRQSLSGGRKFINRSEIQQKRRREDESKRLHQNQNQNQPNGSSFTDKQKPEPSSSPLNLAKEEAIRQLRLLKQPVTLFGESDGDRLDRLNYALHAALFELDDSGIANRKDDVKRMKTDNNNNNFCELCDEDKIVVFFNKLLTEWEKELGEITETEKRTAEGKRTLATYKQCVSYLNPLFNLCRKMVLRDEIREALMLVVKWCMKRDYSAARNHYIGIAIGNSAWPIGVTMVGIHERSAREKIHTNSVAHVMNDETTRKYLTSVKRLITFCERRDSLWEGGLVG